MPNTLAHLGIQSLATRTIIPKADLKWIGLGCIVPDIPWILQRIVNALNIGANVYDLRLYAIVQSSLFMSLVICGALAILSSRPRLVFLILSANSLFHLLLDLIQIKWANGVHLIAPFSWKLLNFGLFWPESLPTLALTIFGLAYILFACFQRHGVPIDIYVGSSARIMAATSLLIVYFLLPIVFLEGPEAADNHSVKVLRATEERSGNYVGFDRNPYIRAESGDRIWSFTGEELLAVGVRPEKSGTVSARGKFIDETTVELLEIKRHAPYFRDLASVIGLFLVALIWIRSWLGRTGH
jgi:hypothetical protein